MAPPRLSTMARKQVQRQARRLKRQSKQQPSASMPAARHGPACLSQNARPWPSVWPVLTLPSKEVSTARAGRT